MPDRLQCQSGASGPPDTIALRQYHTAPIGTRGALERRVAASVIQRDGTNGSAPEAHLGNQLAGDLDKLPIKIKTSDTVELQQCATFDEYSGSRTRPSCIRCVAAIHEPPRARRPPIPPTTRSGDRRDPFGWSRRAVYLARTTRVPHRADPFQASARPLCAMAATGRTVLRTCCGWPADRLAASCVRRATR